MTNITLVIERIPSYNLVTACVFIRSNGFETNTSDEIYPSAPLLGARGPTTSGLPKINIYPNPTNGKAFLNIPDDVSVVSLSVVDQNGQTTQKTRFEQSTSQVVEIDLSLLPSGINWLQIIFNNGIVACEKLDVVH